jgi:hypothetical protein
MQRIKLEIDFNDLSFDGSQPSYSWQAVHRFVGNFTISVAEQVLYSEVEFCLVEFAVQVLQWLQRARAANHDFSYSSVESEHPGLVWIVERNGKWQIGSTYQEYSEEGLFTLDEISAAVEAYVNKLKSELFREFGIDADELMSAYADKLIP